MISEDLIDALLDGVEVVDAVDEAVRLPKELPMAFDYPGAKGVLTRPSIGAQMERAPHLKDKLHPEYYYHVAAASDVGSILKHGLQPKLGDSRAFAKRFTSTMRDVRAGRQSTEGMRNWPRYEFGPGFVFLHRNLKTAQMHKHFMEKLNNNNIPHVILKVHRDGVDPHRAIPDTRYGEPLGHGQRQPDIEMRRNPSLWRSQSYTVGDFSTRLKAFKVKRKTASPYPGLVKPYKRPRSMGAVGHWGKIEPQHIFHHDPQEASRWGDRTAPLDLSQARIK